MKTLIEPKGGEVSAFSVFFSNSDAIAAHQFIPSAAKNPLTDITPIYSNSIVADLPGAPTQLDSGRLMPGMPGMTGWWGLIH